MNPKRRFEHFASSVYSLPLILALALLLSAPAETFAQDPAPEGGSPEPVGVAPGNDGLEQAEEADEATGTPTEGRYDPASLLESHEIDGTENGDESDEALVEVTDDPAQPADGMAGEPPAERLSITPRFRRARGFAFRLEGGRAMWTLDGEQIASQLSPQLRTEVQTLMVDGTHNAPAVTMHLAYNFLGHATVGAELTATGWSVFTPGRGGGGLAAMTLAWHPAELLADLIPIGLFRQRAWDVSLFGGAGWGAVGKDRALRGMHTLFGARAEIYLAPWLAVGGSIKRHGLRFSEYVIHWDNNRFETLPDTSGGSLFVPSISVALRVPTGS